MHTYSYRNEQESKQRVKKCHFSSRIQKSGRRIVLSCRSRFWHLELMLKDIDVADVKYFACSQKLRIRLSLILKYQLTHPLIVVDHYLHTDERVSSSEILGVEGGLNLLAFFLPCAISKAMGTVDGGLCGIRVLEQITGFLVGQQV